MNKKSKQRTVPPLKLTFVGNDDVMQHIMEEISETKVRKDKVHTLASSDVPTPSRPVRTSRKRVNYNEKESGSQQDSDDDDGDDDQEEEMEGEGSDAENEEDALDPVSEETKVRKDKVRTLASSDVPTPSRPVRTSRKRVNYNEKGLASQQDSDDDDEDDEQEEEMEEEDGSDAENDKDALDPVSEVLLDRDGPLGTEVYSFKTPKRSGKMAEIAAKSVDRQQAKRTAVKRKLKRPIGEDKDDSDFSSGQSSDDDDDDDDRDDMNSDTSSERSITIKRPKRASVAAVMTKKDQQPKKATGKGSSAASSKRGDAAAKGATPSGGVRRSNRRAANNDVASMQSDMAEEYFVAHTGQALTSDHTLSRLETPQMGSGELAEALESAPSRYTKEMKELFEEHCAMFNKWMYHLSNDFNILLYGLGSKRRLLEEFRRRQLKDYTSIVVNGYFPSLTVKSILNAISDDVIDAVCNHRNVADQMEFIEEKLDEMDEPLFLLIHNLDGSMLRGSKVQSVLSKIAQINNVHILASIDHINAPLIWDQERSSTFHWMWYDVTTFDPYTDETSYENSLLVRQSGMLALSSLTHVLRSLTPNARGIFNILVEFQLEHKDDGTYNGMSFHELYQKCREAFLVNSDLTLRAQLTEFRDHKLIKSKKSLDGMELLSIPLDNSTLLEFQQQEEL